MCGHYSKPPFSKKLFLIFIFTFSSIFWFKNIFRPQNTHFGMKTNHQNPSKKIDFWERGFEAWLFTLLGVKISKQNFLPKTILLCVSLNRNIKQMSFSFNFFSTSISQNIEKSKNFPVFRFWPLFEITIRSEPSIFGSKNFAG